jgi:hypothetical protein
MKMNPKRIKMGMKMIQETLSLFIREEEIIDMKLLQVDKEVTLEAMDTLQDMVDIDNPSLGLEFSQEIDSPRISLKDKSFKWIDTKIKYLNTTIRKSSKLMMSILSSKRNLLKVKRLSSRGFQNLIHPS